VLAVINADLAFFEAAELVETPVAASGPTKDLARKAARVDCGNVVLFGSASESAILLTADPEDVLYPQCQRV